MKVFKFGGASVKDAESLKNVANILREFEGESLIVVVSAMGKTTNKLEQILASIHQVNKGEFKILLNELKNFHDKIITSLNLDSHQVLSSALGSYYFNIREIFEDYKVSEFNFNYDKIVSFGELISTQIVAAYLEKCNFNSIWLDASLLIKTDDKFRSATVNLPTTTSNIKTALEPFNDEKKLVVTQGFIGSTDDGEITTLGREGSDYSAAIFAYCLNAESLTIWKDVDGMYNADPKKFPKAQKLETISYKDAIELSYYGASVIHPKTIQPLQNKDIPLYVKSFIHPKLSGTTITKDGRNQIPCYIIKENQVLVSLSTKNFSFIAEKHLANIFKAYDSLDMKINIMQNSAVNFSALFDNKQFDENKVLSSFSNNYAVRYNENLELITIRHYNKAIIDELLENREVLLEQKTRETVRFVVK